MVMGHGARVNRKMAGGMLVRVLEVCSWRGLFSERRLRGLFWIPQMKNRFGFDGTESAESLSVSS
jgi:hypothetical protein